MSLIEKCVYMLLLMWYICCTLVLFVLLKLKYYPHLWTLIPTNKFHILPYSTCNLPPPSRNQHKVNPTSTVLVTLSWQVHHMSSQVPCTSLMNTTTNIALTPPPAPPTTTSRDNSTSQRTTVVLKWNAGDKIWDFSTTDVAIWMNQSVVPKYYLGWVLWGGLQDIKCAWFSLEGFIFEFVNFQLSQ